MLLSLEIKDFAVIKSISVDFSSGFSVITGQTGSGKSILLDSIQALLGARFTKDIVRNGSQFAEINGIFGSFDPKTVKSLSDIGVTLNSEGSLYLQRFIYNDGRSVSKLFGKNISMSFNKQIGSILVDFFGQNEGNYFFNPLAHIDLLDDYCKNENILNDYKDLYSEYVNINRRINEIEKARQDRIFKLDFLKYQINEIENAKLKVNEYESLLSERDLLKNYKLISKNANNVYRALYKNDKGVSAYRLIEIARKSIEELAEYVPSQESICNRLLDIQYELSDTAENIYSLIPNGIGNPEERISDLNDRIDVINKLIKKYGKSENELIEYLKQLKSDYAQLEDIDVIIEDAEKERSSILDRLTQIADKLNYQRVAKSKELTSRIAKELSYLDMEKVQLEFNIEKCDLNEKGYDSVEIYVSTNPGDPLNPLSKIASGGEMSRILLSIKSVLANAFNIPTIIFDEIDTGVSGQTADKIGIVMKDISSSSQVISVTHSAQVSSRADNHYIISKDIEDNRAVSTIKKLNYDERISEIARIMSTVKESDIIKESAKEMLDRARNNIL